MSAAGILVAIGLDMPYRPSINIGESLPGDN